jgi:hypothetical protein
MSKTGKSKGKISNGVHSSVSNGTKALVRADYLASPDRLINQMKALRKGKDIALTIENPNKEETNKRFIRVKVNGKEYIANQKKNSFNMKGQASE